MRYTPALHALELHARTMFDVYKAAARRAVAQPGDAAAAAARDEALDAYEAAAEAAGTPAAAAFRREAADLAFALASAAHNAAPSATTAAAYDRALQRYSNAIAAEYNASVEA